MSLKTWLKEQTDALTQILTHEGQTSGRLSLSQYVRVTLEVEIVPDNGIENPSDTEWQRILDACTSDQKTTQALTRLRKSSNQPLTKNELGLDNLSGINAALRRSKSPFAPRRHLTIRKGNSPCYYLARKVKKKKQL